ncbi:hypothetical protein QFZ94_007500 [Paraburkholderia sp. JPY465]|uniref:hypothetical protein n=1 Tax=Paraburkholderia sp. JPY465 TaxID=3042285 RepID=UPI003D1A52D0
MSYRRVLRTVPKALRRAWWRQRYQYDEPRTAIGNGPLCYLSRASHREPVQQV